MRRASDTNLECVGQLFLPKSNLPAQFKLQCGSESYLRKGRDSRDPTWNHAFIINANFQLGRNKSYAFSHPHEINHQVRRENPRLSQEDLPSRPAAHHTSDVMNFAPNLSRSGAGGKKNLLGKQRRRIEPRIAISRPFLRPTNQTLQFAMVTAQTDPTGGERLNGMIASDRTVSEC